MSKDEEDVCAWLRAYGRPPLAQDVNMLVAYGAECAEALEAELATMTDDLHREQDYLSRVRTALGSNDDPRETLDMARAAIARADRAEAERDEARACHELASDAAMQTLEQLTAAQEQNEKLRGALERMHCGCTSKDCVRHGAFDPDDAEWTHRALAAPPADEKARGA